MEFSRFWMMRCLNFMTLMMPWGRMPFAPTSLIMHEFLTALKRHAGFQARLGGIQQSLFFYLTDGVTAFALNLFDSTLGKLGFLT
jgi:hypothetical protein